MHSGHVFLLSPMIFRFSMKNILLIILHLFMLPVHQLNAAQLNRSFATAAQLKTEFFSAQHQQQDVGHTALATQSSTVSQESFIKFMQSHTVPADIQTPLDVLFSKNQVQKVMAKMNSVTNTILLEKELPAICKELSSCGFAYKDRRRPHILTYPTVPAWILKLPTPWFEGSVADTWAAERRNGGRIAYAYKIAEYCKAKKHSVVLPTKYAYCLPKIKEMNMPLYCVVAQQLDLSKDQAALTPEQEKIMTDLYENMGFTDDTAGNRFNLGATFALVDTEPDNKVLQTLF